MREIVIKAYTFSELSDEAKKRAINHWRDNRSEYNWIDENRQTMEAFAAIFPITVTNWSYGDRNEGVTFRFTNEQVQELKGQHLATYLWNNYKHQLWKGKYYSLWSANEVSYKYHKEGLPVLKQRHSKILLEHSCVLTGYCMDDDILDAMYKFIDNPKPNVTFRELLKECFANWIKACNADIEYQDSDEYIIEEIDSNDYEFDEFGKQL